MFILFPRKDFNSFYWFIPTTFLCLSFLFLEVVGVILVIGDIFNHHCLNLFSLIF